jgi:hypothetical protein
MRFTPRMRLFAHEFMVDNDARQAAIRVGYKPKSASARAYSLMRNPHVKAEIHALQSAQKKRLEIDSDEVLGELLRIAMSSPSDLFDEHGEMKSIQDIPREVMACVKRIKKRIDKDTGLPCFEVAFWDKPRSLETLCRHLGLLQDNTNVRFPDGIPNELKVMSDGEIDEAIKQEAERIDKTLN